MKIEFFFNPYVQIILGVALIIISSINLKLTPPRILSGLNGGLAEFLTSPTAQEKEELKEGPQMALGCWVFLLGLGLILSGVFRLVVANY